MLPNASRAQWVMHWRLAHAKLAAAFIAARYWFASGLLHGAQASSISGKWKPYLPDDRRSTAATDSWPAGDHAAAVPIEVLVSRDADGIEVSLVDEMYRMKMFFEDAGKMAFAKNMGMPGSIEGEIKKKIESILR